MFVCLHWELTLQQPVISVTLVIHPCVYLSVLSLPANGIHKTKRIKCLLRSLLWVQSKMAEICGSGFSQHVHSYLKHNAEETTLLAKKKNHNSFKEVLRVPSKQLWEHNISQCVAFCFVSTKAAVHRKSLDSLWIAALPTESGTEPGEESWLQLSIMFLDCLFTITDLLTFQLLISDLRSFMMKWMPAFADRIGSFKSFYILSF